LSLPLTLRLALADYRERTRRFGFLLTLGITLWAAYMFVPPNGSVYSTLRMGEYRGVYNSAWVGTLVALETTVFLGLAGFYLVKNSIARDIRTRVGEILAATRTTSGRYLLSKFISNLAVLETIIAVSIVAAGITQLIRGESTQIDLVALVLPFVLLSLPMMALVAALAVLFETVRWLRGGFGNVVYYFLWTALLIAGMPGKGGSGGVADPTGTMLAMEQIGSACQTAFPEFDPDRDGVSLGVNIRGDGERVNLSTFEWHGVEWDARSTGTRLMWLGLAFLLVLPARALFDRQTFSAPAGRAKKKGATAAAADEDTGQGNGQTDIAPGAGRVGSSFLSAATAGAGRWRFAGLVNAELRLALKGTSLWWYLVALGLILGCLFAPQSAVRAFIFPMAWIWPILMWSPLGTRERQFGTEGFMHSAPAPVWRQLPAVWLAGVLIAVVTGSGIAVRFAVAGDLAGLGGWLVGALFIPTLAICLGSLSGSGKLFEILYLILWYAGPLNAVPMLDYMGATAESVATGMPWRFLVITALLGAGAVAAKQVKLRR